MVNGTPVTDGWYHFTGDQETSWRQAYGTFPHVWVIRVRFRDHRVEPPAISPSMMCDWPKEPVILGCTDPNAGNYDPRPRWMTELHHRLS